MSDTLWRVRDGRGVAIVDRTGVVGAQTPQAAPLETLRDAIIDALGRDEAPTDEAAALLAHGVAVVTVPGDPANRKLTTPGDEGLVRDALRARLLGPISTAADDGTGGDRVRRAPAGRGASRCASPASSGPTSDGARRATRTATSRCTR